MKGVSVSGFSLVAPPSTAELAAVKEEREDVAEEELELGLSLGGGGGGGKGASWGEYCRILTAKDLPAIRSRSSPRSSNSSVSSSSPSPACGGVGSKRTAESVVDVVGSTSPPSGQVVVGWPPIRAFRMNTMVSSQSIRDNNEEASKDPERKPVAASSRFVKVNIDGDPIGRKVDLNAHHSYGTLAVALEIMFHRPTTVSSYGGKVSKLLDGSSEYALTYEDKDGDWMLVGDVPWCMFLDTVKRLRIMRTSDASGLAPRFRPLDETSGPVGSKPV